MISADPLQPGHPDLPAVKKQWRSKIRRARKERYGSDAGAALRTREGLALLAGARPILDEVRRVLDERGRAVVSAFHPMATEPDVVPLVKELRALGDVTILFPASSGGPELDWIAWDGDESFAQSSGAGFGAEPRGERLGADALSTADVVLTPALAIGLDGARLGHGGGYYDRALRHVRDGIRATSIVHPTEVIEAGLLPREDHDAPIDAVLTADGLRPLGA